jgi:aspartyl-tRNA(Asn)/glutamyl-tRNA(Gln) amidotransferase subunit C
MPRKVGQGGRADGPGRPKRESSASDPPNDSANAPAAARIGQADVEHVARLARLHLSDEELDRMRVQLDAILAYIDKLTALDVQGVEPTSHAVPLVNVMRSDEVTACLPQSEALANAPDPAGDFFRVPRIIED